MNIRKLRKLQRWIMAEPRRYYQGWWILGDGSVIVSEQKPPCGIAACLAGTACLMEGYKPQFEGSDWAETVRKTGGRVLGVPKLARKILDLTHKQAGYLFQGDAEGWSERACQAYKEAKTPRGRAKAACMAIEDLIQGRESGLRRKHDS